MFFQNKLVTFICCLFFSLVARSNEHDNCDASIKKGHLDLDKGNYIESIKIFSKAKEIAKSNNWYDLEFKALNGIGISYLTISDYDDALKSFYEAYKLATQKLDSKSETMVLNNIASLYSRQGSPEKSVDFLIKAYTLAKQSKDDFKTGMYATNIGSVKNDLKKYNEAIAYFSEALNLLKETPEYLIFPKAGLANCYYLQGKNNQARQLALDLLNKIAVSKVEKYNDVSIPLMGIIVKSYLKDGKYDLAISYANQALKRNPDLSIKKEVYESLSKAYQKKNELGLSLRFKDSAISQDLKLDKIKEDNQYQANKFRLEMLSYKNEIAKNQIEISSQKKQFYFLLITLGSILIIVIIVLMNIKQKETIAERNAKIIALELDRTEKDNLLLKKSISEKEIEAKLEYERLKNEIETKNRELTSKALYLSNKNQVIEEVISELSSMPELSKEGEIGNHLKTLRKNLKSDDEWDDFLKHFEETSQGFIFSLKQKHPDLNTNDIKYLSYVYMNLSSKEIASLLNITIDACRKRKERLIDKLGIPHNTMLYDYLASLWIYKN